MELDGDYNGLSCSVRKIDLSIIISDSNSSELCRIENLPWRLLLLLLFLTIELKITFFVNAHLLSYINVKSFHVAVSFSLKFHQGAVLKSS